MQELSAPGAVGRGAEDIAVDQLPARRLHRVLLSSTGGQERKERERREARRVFKTRGRVESGREKEEEEKRSSANLVLVVVAGDVAAESADDDDGGDA